MLNLCVISEVVFTTKELALLYGGMKQCGWTKKRITQSLGGTGTFGCAGCTCHRLAICSTSSGPGGTECDFCFFFFNRKKVDLQGSEWSGSKDFLIDIICSFSPNFVAPCNQWSTSGWWLMVRQITGSTNYIESDFDLGISSSETTKLSLQETLRPMIFLMSCGLKILKRPLVGPYSGHASGW